MKTSVVIPDPDPRVKVQSGDLVRLKGNGAILMAGGAGSESARFFTLLYRTWPQSGEVDALGRRYEIANIGEYERLPAGTKIILEQE